MLFQINIMIVEPRDQEWMGLHPPKMELAELEGLCITHLEYWRDQQTHLRLHMRITEHQGHLELLMFRVSPNHVIYRRTQWLKSSIWII